MVKKIVTILLLSSLISSTVFGQETSKKRVAIYGDIYRITKQMDQKLNFFSDQYDSFIAAELYRLNEQSYELEIEQKEENEVQVTTIRMSKSEADMFKEKIAQRIKEKDIALKYDHTGRFLKVQSNAMQGALAGLAFSSLLSDDQYGLKIGLPLIGLGSGILGGILATSKRDVPLAESMGYASGSFTGAFHGAFVGLLLSDPDVYDNTKPIILSSLAFSVGESLLLQHIVRNNNWSPKRASALRLGNLSGGITGGGLSMILGGEYGNRYVTTLFTLGGSTAGILLYDRYFRNKDIAVGNMQAIRLMNPIFTGGASVVIGDLANFESLASLGAVIMATSIGGVFLGEALFKNGHVTYSESLWYGLGLYGGFYLGYGISIVALYNADSYLNIGALIAGIITLTSLGGMYTVHSIVANNIDDEGEIGFLEKNNIQISANPGAVFMNKILNNPLQQQNAVSIRWTF